MTNFKKFDTLALIIVVALVAVDGYLWLLVLSGSGVPFPREYFLDVGQGDSELLVFPHNVKVMTDAGPGSAAIDALQSVLPQGDHYIDLAVISHPDLDHFGGYLDVIDHYEIGAFLYNGRDGDSDAWRKLIAKINTKHIPIVTVGAGDRVYCGASVIGILSPGPAFAESAEANDASIVEFVDADPGGTNEFTTLLTGDAPLSVENYLLAHGTVGSRAIADVHADILKIAHHGSKYASGGAFLRAVNPAAAVIGVGAKNVYGHPSKEALARIASSTHAAVFRTDLNGSVEIFAENGALRIFTEKQTAEKQAAP